MEHGRHRHPAVITRAFDRLVAASQLPRIALTICAGHASHLLAAGTNVKLVSDRLGHASVAFTLDTTGTSSPANGLTSRRRSPRWSTPFR